MLYLLKYVTSYAQDIINVKTVLLATWTLTEDSILSIYWTVLLFVQSLLKYKQ